MELALSLEKLTNEKLLNLHNVRHVYWVFVSCLMVIFSFILALKLIKLNFHYFNLMYVCSTGCLKDWWCAVGRLCGKWVFGWTGMHEITFLQLTIFLCFVQEIVHNCVTHEIQILPFNYYFSFHRWKPSKKSQSMLLS